MKQMAEVERLKKTSRQNPKFDEEMQSLKSELAERTSQHTDNHISFTEEIQSLRKQLERGNLRNAKLEEDLAASHVERTTLHGAHSDKDELVRQLKQAREEDAFKTYRMI